MRLALLFLSIAGFTACSSSDASDVDTMIDEVGADDVLDIDIACADTIDSIYADPGPLPAEKGAVLRCARDQDLSADDIAKALPNYVGKPFTSGAHVYRILYRTERGDAANTPATSSAAVLIPMLPRASKVPLVVVSHGTRGQAPVCTASKLAELYQTGPLVGAGYAVIAPDLAGFNHYGAKHNPPSVYAGSADVGKSTLDGARALRNMVGSLLSDKIVLVGHSQGGHTSLSALAMSARYDAGGPIVGVFAYAPLWISQASWGALPVLATDFPFKDYKLLNSAAIWYMYTHGEALDGPGHGDDIFRPSKRAAIKSFVDNVCLSEADGPLQAMGETIDDVYDPSFSRSVAGPVGLGVPCGDELCEKWAARFAADRPHLTGSARKVPIHIAYGADDTSIPPERMACVLDRLEQDQAAHEICVEPGADHGSIVGKQADLANAWIGALTLGEPKPPACKTAFMPPECATPPPND